MIRLLSAMLIAVLAATTTLGGCAADRSPGAGRADSFPAPMNDPQISVQPPEMRQWLGFHPAYVRQDGQRPMHVEVPVRNETENQYFIDYRILFYDAGGFELEPVMGWSMVPMGPKQVVRLKGSALSTEAQSYRLEVKWAK